MQIPLPVPPLPPGFKTPPDFFFFAMVYGLILELVVLVLPRKWRDGIIKIAFPFLPPR